MIHVQHILAREMCLWFSNNFSYWNSCQPTNSSGYETSIFM